MDKSIENLKFNRRGILAIFAFLFLNLSAFAQTGIIKGSVVDAVTNEVLVGAVVRLEGSTTGGATDLDGLFNLPAVKVGTYTLTVSYISYKQVILENVVVENNKETLLDIKMESSDINLQNVIIVARANRENIAVLLNSQKLSGIIQENVGARQLSVQGVSDAASASTKITGVTRSESSGEVFVRGLGDRYLATTMNGLPIPSDNVDKKNIDLGLFETSIIQNLGISKTYNGEGFIDQTAGNVNIVSKEYVDKVALSLQSGTNTTLLTNDIWKNFKVSPNYKQSLLSFHKTGNSLQTNLTEQSWDPSTLSIPLDWGFSAMGGAKTNIAGHQLLSFSTISYKQEHQYSSGIYRKYVENILQNEFLDAQSWSSTQNLTGLLNLYYNIGEKLQLSFNSLFINKLSDNVYEQGRNQSGYVRDSGEPSEDHVFDRDQNTKTTLLLVEQILGKHKLNEKNSLSWALGYNLVNASEPNRIRNRVGVYDNLLFVDMHGIGNFDNRKSSQKIVDNEINGYVKDEWEFLLGDSKIKSTAGVNFRHKNRSFVSNFAGADIKDLSMTNIKIDHLSNIFTQSEFNSSLIRVLPQDVYDASLNAAGGFLNLGFDYGAFDGSIGARIEANNINLSWDISNDQYSDVEYRNKLYWNVYPSLNLKYEMTEKQNLRLSGSKTITLPEFKELAPFPYVSPTGNITKGNPELLLSNNYNIDLKWEYFKDRGELLSFASFVKYIQDPINVTMERGAGRSFITANTGENATVLGLEAEARLNIYETDNAVLRFIGNATKMWFNQNLLPKYQYNNKTTTGLQGAPEFISNVSLSYENQKNNLIASISGNYSSDRIAALGHPLSASEPNVYFNEDIIEKGFISLDVVLSYNLTDKIALKLTGKNLLNPTIEQTQKIKTFDNIESEQFVESYQKGTKMQFTINYTF